MEIGNRIRARRQQLGLSAEELGEEGYLLTIGDYVTVTSPTVTGMTYGGASITQILYQDEGRDNAPKGTARDYPKYAVRAGMIDVGRMYIPLEYLEENGIVPDSWINGKLGDFADIKRGGSPRPIQEYLSESDLA